MADFMPQQQGGLLDGIVNGQNPLVNFGLGILANNTGHYGAFAPAFGQGMQQGISQTQIGQQALQRRKLMEAQIRQQQVEDDLMKQKMERMKAMEEWRQRFGKENDTQSTVTPGGYENAPQGTEAPNFNVVKQPDQVKENPYFNMDKWVTEGIGVGGVDPMDLMKLQKGDHEYGYSDGVLYDKKSGSFMQIPTAKDDKERTNDIKNFEYAKNQGYKGSFDQFVQLKQLNPIAWANLGLAQDRESRAQREDAYKLPPTPKASKKIFKLDDGGSVSATYDASVGKYYVMKSGVKHWVEE